jgi:hypothetical protein
VVHRPTIRHSADNSASKFGSSFTFENGAAIGSEEGQPNVVSWDEAVIRKHGREGRVLAEPAVRDPEKADRGTTEDGPSADRQLFGMKEREAAIRSGILR